MRDCARARMYPPRGASGVTLIELVIVMVLTGILGALMATFVAPILQYREAARRAELTDIADTALRRMGRDLRNALPNSVRVTSALGVQYIELLLVRSGGRYRSDTGAIGGTACPAVDGADAVPDALRIDPTGAHADTCFKSLGSIANFSDIVPNNDYVVVYNLQPGTAGADAYAFPGTGGNKSLITAVAAEAGQVRFTIQSNIFTNESPSQRFQVIEGPVTYACDPTGQTLTRYSGYAISAAQPTPPASGASLLVSGVTACTFAYDTNALGQAVGFGLASLALSVTSKDLKGTSETVSLYQTVHVSNVP